MLVDRLICWWLGLRPPVLARAVTVVTNDVGECVAVTITDEHHEVLRTLWERL